MKKKTMVILKESLTSTAAQMKHPSMEKATPTGKKQDGYSYILLLVAIVIIGIFLAVANKTTTYLVQKEREKDLLFAGKAYVKAIESYYRAGSSPKTYPMNLEDLLKDPRFLLKRHIPRLYKDPFGKDFTDWQLLRSKTGGITGVASSSNKRPLKQKNFPLGLETFEGAESYRDWVFEYRPSEKH